MILILIAFLPSIYVVWLETKKPWLVGYLEKALPRHLFVVVVVVDYFITCVSAIKWCVGHQLFLILILYFNYLTTSQNSSDFYKVKIRIPRLLF